MVLSTGKTFTFRGGTKEDRAAEQVSYAVLDPKSARRSEMRIVEMPSADHEGLPPKRLCVVRETEQIPVPDHQADLGNFGVSDVGPSETRLVVAEYPINTPRHAERNAVFAAKITWPAAAK